MSTEFNYVVKLDTTSVMGSLAEVRNQIGMAFGGSGGGGASGQMMRGLERGVMSGFGRTHTDPSISYDPNYGRVFASTTRAQEDAVSRHGLAAAEAMRPPGVSAYEYGMGVHGNAVQRQQDARHQAGMAAQSAFFSGVGGLAGGEVGFLAGGAVGRVAGGAIAKRFLGAGAVGAGRMIGGLGLGMAAAFKAEEMIGGRIREHFAEVEQIGGMTKELGDIVGGGRGLSKEQQYRTGIAAREAAKDINMDIQQMGDIASLGRATGLLPSTTDPTKLRDQLGNLAKAVDEGASALHTSLGNAAMVIRSASKQGISAEEGILNAGAAGGAEKYLAQQSRHQAFGASGGQFAMQQRLTQQQGFAMFTGAIGQAAGAGMSGDAMKILGGKYGAAQLVAAGQIGAATSPMGDMQLMAAAGGFAGGDMMSLPGQAMSAMSQGGDFIGNMMKFQVHKDELRRGIGVKGLRTLARQQAISGGEMFQGISPGLSDREGRAMYAQNVMGMDSTQAWLYSGAIMKSPGGGGGGKSGAAYARRLDTFQDMQLHRSGLAAIENFDEKGSKDYSSGYGFGLGNTAEFAVTGAMVGGVKGAILGGAAGLVAANAKAAWNLGSDLFGSGPGLMSSAQDKADFYNLRGAAAYDQKVSDFKRQYGSVDINQDVAARIRKAPLQHTQLDFDSFGGRASSRYGGWVDIAGVSSVQAGRGTMRIGGRNVNIGEMREAAEMLDKAPEVNAKAISLAHTAVIVNRTEDTKSARDTFRNSWEQLARNEFGPTTRPGESAPDDEAFIAAARSERSATINRMQQSARTLINASGSGGDKLRAAFEMGGARGGITSDKVRGFLKVAAGGTEWDMPKISAGMMGDIMLAGGASKRELEIREGLINWSTKAYTDAPGDARAKIPLLAHPAEASESFAGKVYGVDFTSEDVARHMERGRRPSAPRESFEGKVYGVDFSAEDVARYNAENKRISSVNTLNVDREYIKTIFGRRDFRAAMADNKARKVKEIMNEVGLNPEFESVRSDQIFDKMMHSKRSPVEVDGSPLKTFFEAAKALTSGEGLDVASQIIREATTPVSLNTEIREAMRETGDLGTNFESPAAGKKISKKPKPLAHAIGFGQQESALTTINKTLRRTHSMIVSLDKRISNGKPTGGTNKADLGG